MDYYVVEYERISCGDSADREILYIDMDKEKAIERAKNIVEKSETKYLIQETYTRPYVFLAKDQFGTSGQFITVEKFTF